MPGMDSALILSVLSALVAAVWTVWTARTGGGPIHVSRNVCPFVPGHEAQFRLKQERTCFSTGLAIKFETD